MSEESLQTKIILCLQKAKEIDPKSCFVIAKSGNKNVLTYSFTKNKDIIKPYWLMYENLKNSLKPPVEDINFIENQLAYGISIKKKENLYEINIVGYPNTPILMDPEKNIALVYNKQRLLGLYIHENTANIFKPVEGVTIIYEDLNKKIIEKFIKK